MIAVRVSCDGKMPFLSWSEANKAMSRGRFQDRRDRGRMNVYRCRYCHHYHIGRSNLL